MADRGPRHDRRYTSPEDAALEARLGQALRDEHGEQHVDVTQLLRGTRVAVRERRSRTRRFTVLAAAGVAAASIPVAVQAAQWSGTSANGPVQPGGAPPVTTQVSPPTEEASPSPSPPPVRVTPTPEQPDATSFDIPDEVAFSAKDFKVLDRRLELQTDTGQYARVPTVPGQGCSEARWRRYGLPLNGRSWDWVQEGRSRPDAYAVTLNVTRWEPEAGLRQIELLRTDVGSCRFVGDVTRGVVNGRAWSGLTRRPDGVVAAHAAQWLKGDVVVGVSVVSPDGAEDALSLAGTLTEIAAARFYEAESAVPDPQGGELPDPGSAPARSSGPEGVTPP